MNLISSCTYFIWYYSIKCCNICNSFFRSICYRTSQIRKNLVLTYLLNIFISKLSGYFERFLKSFLTCLNYCWLWWDCVSDFCCHVIFGLMYRVNGAALSFSIATRISVRSFMKSFFHNSLAYCSIQNQPFRESQQSLIEYLDLPI